MAKAGPPDPSWKAIATAKADTVAEWDEGIPPESSIRLDSHFLSLYLRGQKPTKHHKLSTGMGSLRSWRNVEKSGNGKDQEREPGGKEFEKLGDGASEEGGEEGEIGSEERSRRGFNGRWGCIPNRHHLVHEHTAQNCTSLVSHRKVKRGREDVIPIGEEDRIRRLVVKEKPSLPLIVFLFYSDIWVICIDK